MGWIKVLWKDCLARCGRYILIALKRLIHFKTLLQTFLMCEFWGTGNYSCNPRPRSMWLSTAFIIILLWHVNVYWHSPWILFWQYLMPLHCSLSKMKWVSDNCWAADSCVPKFCIVLCIYSFKRVCSSSVISKLGSLKFTCERHGKHCEFKFDLWCMWQKPCSLALPETVKYMHS